MLNQKVRADLIVALKSGDKTRTTVLRNLLAEIKNKEIDLQHELNDQETVEVLRKQVKMLSDAKTIFAKGGRPDLARQNELEVRILAAYLRMEIGND